MSFLSLSMGDREYLEVDTITINMLLPFKLENEVKKEKKDEKTYQNY